jgi:phosphoglycolate phosphatase
MVEVVNPVASARNARVVMLDFDGTLSLIRSGWQEVMTGMMVDGLAALRSGESRERLRALVDEFITRLTGRETIHQMAEYASQIAMRGGAPASAQEYKLDYSERLDGLIRQRREALRTGKALPQDYLLPGAMAMLDRLQERGLLLYLASGTDHASVLEEVELLGLNDYFGPRVFGALDDPQAFSKGQLVRKLVEEAGYKGAELLGIGDGPVELEVVKAVGGTTVGVAAVEPACVEFDQTKQRRLAQAGADVVIANYLEWPMLESLLFA